MDLSRFQNICHSALIWSKVKLLSHGGFGHNIAQPILAGNNQPSITQRGLLLTVVASYLVGSFFSILLTHEGSHREAYRDFQPSWTSSAGGAKGCSDHRFRAPPAYTAQLPTLHQHRAENQYRTANQI